MLGKFLLIDQRLNETRLAIVKDMVLEDFDDELSTKKLKKGNVYIGRIMRIEHSLQAAFVDFGFEKHGFLAFSEIVGPDSPPARSTPAKPAEPEPNESSITLAPPITPSITLDPVTEFSVNDDDERPARPMGVHGKVHDFIKRQQLIMVQVIKDERGSKGAALTTYISLPGRYGFFLPNTPKASGVSKKITDSTERDALKGILGTLNVPEGMSFILRSAAIGRKKSEIKRDYEFLMKTWTAISAHPVNTIGLVYAEQDLLIRALRDFYTSDVQHVVIQGEEAFKRARSYIRAVFPSYAKKIQLHSETGSLFEKFNIESQIEAIYNHTVLLPSGGSIVLNQTEALVSIDVNSSKSTQERNIEDTALKTNLEACIAIARNLKLRDLSGLIVIDFIDLHPNKRPVIEKALKDALATDRARLKVGKISEFGLLEMSRQRLRQSLMESNTYLCTTCHGAGRLLSLPMQSMRALRAIEHMAATQHSKTIDASGSADLVLCLLNMHREFLWEIEKKYGTSIMISVDPACDSGALTITNPSLLTEIKSTATVGGPKKRRRNRSRSGKNSDISAESHTADLTSPNTCANATPSDTHHNAVPLDTPPASSVTASIIPIPLTQALSPEGLPLSSASPVKESRWAKLRKRRQAKIQATAIDDGPFLLTNPIGIDADAPAEPESPTIPAATESLSFAVSAIKDTSSASNIATEKPQVKPRRKGKKQTDQPSRSDTNAMPQEAEKSETQHTAEQKIPQTEGVKPQESPQKVLNHRKRQNAKKDRPTPTASSALIHSNGVTAEPILATMPPVVNTGEASSKEADVTQSNPSNEHQKKRLKRKTVLPKDSSAPSSSVPLAKDNPSPRLSPVRPPRVKEKTNRFQEKDSPVRVKLAGGIVLLPTRSK
ncbi:MAG: Rne/Rng family ribonuclease [Alphaproteobacteria bacterium]|nr:Rne/Rng family ribonuclease [Alphaproteobacteria bacterium]